MIQPEAKFKKKLCEIYGDIFPKGFHFYFPAAVKFGVPDLYFTLGGRGVWVEGKVEERPLRKIQEVQIARMRGAGERVMIVDLVNPKEKKDKQLINVRTSHEDAEMATMVMFKRDDLWSKAFWTLLSGVTC